MRVYVLDRDYVVIDAEARGPISTGARWHLASGGGFYGMHVMWPYGPTLDSHSWPLSMN